MLRALPTRPTRTRCATSTFALVLGLSLLRAAPADAGIHTWDVREVFSDASGTIQYIELRDNGTTGSEVGVGNGSLTSGSQTHAWSNGAVTGPTNGRSYLIATPAFAALPGAPTPDVILPANKVPFFDPAGDTIAFTTVDSWAFGAVPTDGVQSLDRVSGAGANTPKNYAGIEGNVDAGAAAVPTATFWMGLLLVASLALLGARRLSNRAGALG
ncbi:MAG: hypothetical protein R3F35_07635 [Myxococcota bacterium]